MASRQISVDELNKTALEHFVYQPVNREMISYLAQAAHNVIICDPVPPRTQLPPSPPGTPESGNEEPQLPTLEEFITQLVVSSNVQVPTLMSSLVYLHRLKSKLQPQARGIRCTAHRIFLAALILSAKYLNDSSPKNKHWASYTNMATDYYHFGFNRQEVNTMEKQLLFLLEWDLKISEADLYRELDYFLSPLRRKISDRHARKMAEREDKRRQEELHEAARRYPSPPRSRYVGSMHSRSASGDSMGAPPDLAYSSDASSYDSDDNDSSSRASSPRYDSPPASYDSPVEIVMDYDVGKTHGHESGMLPYEITADQYHQMQSEEQSKKRAPPVVKRSVLGRILGTGRY
ncbi:unnamed protein product [Clonostachys byssicola]|uniref:Cyclin N-terminal domain-containing protein n=1 Tax=Clonostachys byssicola TaxID=160290 RepID=A0A9N9Y5W5_9HYPO|nr:unnamed protein product [Clonostachys byssicola]